MPWKKAVVAMGDLSAASGQVGYDAQALPARFADVARRVDDLPNQIVDSLVVADTVPTAALTRVQNDIAGLKKLVDVVGWKQPVTQREAHQQLDAVRAALDPDAVRRGVIV